MTALQQQTSVVETFSRDKIERLEREILKQDQIDIPVTHHFAPGIYARSIVIPKGATLTGHIHLTEHLNIVSKGELSVMTEHGIERVSAGAHIVSKPGIKRVGYAHEETIWTTIHATDETDHAKLEALLVVKTFADFEALQVAERLQLEAVQ